MDFKYKYLKYKTKYIELQKKIGGKIDDYNVPDIVTKLKQEFLEYANSNKTNNNIPDDKHDFTDKKEITIGTYNIHYFTNVYENENTYDKIIKDIRDMKLDILLLEEALLGTNIQINKNLYVDSSSFYEEMNKLGYKKIIVCSNVPSWFNGVYSNILLIHQSILDLGITEEESYCKKNYNSCEHLNEYIYSFEKAKTATTVSGMYKGTKETRCYIYINFKFNNMNIHLYGTHLDVASENERLNQIKQIIESAKQFNTENDYVIIMGDFNTNDLSKKYLDEKKNVYVTTNNYTKDNIKVIKQLKDSKYIDIFQRDMSKVEMTAWNNFVVDYIFIKNGKNKPIPEKFKSSIYYTDASDHFPIILTITK